jgi:hypothetical protein
MKFILIFLLFFISFVNADDNKTDASKYVLGEGLQIASLPLYIGGYFSTDYRYSDDFKRYRLDDIAGLMYGDYNKFSYMAEFEFKELYIVTRTNNTTIKKTNTTLHTERLYVDYNYDENFRLRVGKYNSPIGYWNLLPINVLRDTTSSPKSTYILFPKFTTGLYGSYTLFNDSEFGIDVMLQNNNDLDPHYNNYDLDDHYGVGFRFAKNNLSLKLNIGAFDDNRDITTKELYYILTSLKYEEEKYTIMGEIGSQRSDKTFTTKYAGYLQGVYYYNIHHSAILRLESYNNERKSEQDNIAIVGYTYRPLYPVALKTEYQLHKKSKKNQILFSFSVLF